VGRVRGVSCVWWEDVQISSKRKAIDTKVASHMIRGAETEGTVEKRVCTVRKPEMWWVG
jgi:hypothetical protein